MSHTSNHSTPQNVSDDFFEMLCAYPAGDPYPTTTTFTWPEYRRQQHLPPPPSPVHPPFNPTVDSYHYGEYYGGSCRGSHAFPPYPDSGYQLSPAPSTPSNAHEAHLITENAAELKRAMYKSYPAWSKFPDKPFTCHAYRGSRWLCQWPGCQQIVWRMDRRTHAMRHTGKMRYICSCGQSFERPKEKKRHIRELGVCKRCPWPVGKGGWSGICSTCLKK